MRQSNGTIMVYPIKDIVHGRMYQVSIKGLDGGVKIEGRGLSRAAAIGVAKQWAAFTGFPLIQPEYEAPSYWVAVGNDYTFGRGQYKIIAKSYVQAHQMAKNAGLGSYPILDYPFSGLPDLGRITSC